jgi:hypothetical protein
MTTLVKLSLVGTAALPVAGGLAVWMASTRWTAATEDVRVRLEAAMPAETGARFTAADLQGLPASAARYFQAVLREGQPIIEHARVEWAGEFNIGTPGADRWIPFAASQDFVPSAPGLVWDARLRMAPGVTLFVRDALVDGTGSMHGSVLGLYTVVDKRGTDAMAIASLQRYLAEAVWFPTALLPSRGVRWTAIHDTCANATIRAGNVSATVEFHFGEDGLVESTFVPDRVYDDGRSAPYAASWQGRMDDYRWENGARVPGEAVAEWLLPTGTYAYWRGRPTSIVYRLR